MTLYFYRSHLYIPYWKHNEQLFAYSMGSFPNAPENYSNLASYYLDSKRWMDAIKPLLCAEKLSKGHNFNIHMNLATAYLESGIPGLLPRALEQNRKAFAIAPPRDKHFLEGQRNFINNKMVELKRSKKGRK